MAERKPGRGRPQAVGEALRSYLARSGLGRRLAQAQVIPDWPVLVGPQIATHGAADHGRAQRRPRRRTDQDDTLASLNLERYGESKTPSREG